MFFTWRPNHSGPQQWGANPQAWRLQPPQTLGYLESMEARPFERLGRELTRFGVGTSGLIGRPDVSESDVERALSDAVERGASVLDTAPYLGDGERLCAQVVRSLHAEERALLCTRVPAANPAAAGAELLMDDDGQIFRDPLVRSFSAASLEAVVETSLAATGLEALPLCLLEGWHDSWLASPAWPEVTDAMAQLCRQGKVRRWGLCVPRASLEHASAVLDEPLISAVAAPHSLWLPGSAKLAQAAAARQVAFLAQGVLGQGGLSGEITASARFRLGDVRGERFADRRGLVELARRTAELSAFTKEVPPSAESCDEGKQALERARRDPELRECRTLVELALRFALSTAEVATALVGCSSVDHVRENLAGCARGPLPDHVLGPLRALLARWAARRAASDAAAQ